MHWTATNFTNWVSTQECIRPRLGKIHVWEVCFKDYQDGGYFDLQTVEGCYMDASIRPRLVASHLSVHEKHLFKSFQDGGHDDLNFASDWKSVLQAWELSIYSCFSWVEIQSSGSCEVIEEYQGGGHFELIVNWTKTNFANLWKGCFRQALVESIKRFIRSSLKVYKMTTFWHDYSSNHDQLCKVEKMSMQVCFRLSLVTIHYAVSKKSLNGFQDSGHFGNYISDWNNFHKVLKRSNQVCFQPSLVKIYLAIQKSF